MAKYAVVAATKDGEQYNEAVEANDKFDVYRIIRARGDRVVSMAEEGGGWSFKMITDLFSQVSADERVVFARNIAAMIDAGLTVARALSVMERQTTSARMRSVISAVISDINEGSTLSAAFGKHGEIFSPLMVSMTRAGEESGTLASSLRVVSEQMERSNNLSKKIRGAMIYPGIVVAAMVGIGILMLIYVVPTLTATFKDVGAQLPASTKAIIAVSNFLVENTLLALILMAGVVVGSMLALRTATGKRAMDNAVMYMPIIRPLVIEVFAARTARTLSSLLSAGVDVVLSIAITRDVVNNSVFGMVLGEAEEAVVKGGQLSVTFAKYPKLYPPLVSEMLVVGEETGRISDLLKELATFYEESVERKTKDLSTIIEPLLMVVIGGGVGFFAVSMIAPIYSLSNSI
ncbi:MAG: hypothetical protein RLZZ283_165 [Candidatus Parcubacteria bacterium]|jgi:type IV pilus assembly protein PilC